MFLHQNIWYELTEGVICFVTVWRITHSDQNLYARSLKLPLTISSKVKHMIKFARIPCTSCLHTCDPSMLFRIMNYLRYDLAAVPTLPLIQILIPSCRTIDRGWILIASRRFYNSDLKHLLWQYRALACETNSDYHFFICIVGMWPGKPRRAAVAVHMGLIVRLRAVWPM